MNTPTTKLTRREKIAAHQKSLSWQPIHSLPREPIDHVPSPLETALKACDDIDRAHDPVDAPGAVMTARWRLLRDDITGKRLRIPSGRNQAQKRRAIRNNPQLRMR